tara:strand:+ start:666 stop:1220 length:555 start_codon:yes stop_codon:yes gene_type:complete
MKSVREKLWNKMRGKDYRHAFSATHLSTNTAAQIQTMREYRGWTQKELADSAGMSQPRISKLEDPSYETASLSTLKRVAEAFDTALIVRFVGFSELVDWVTDISPSKMNAPSFSEDELAHHLIAEPIQQAAPTINQGSFMLAPAGDRLLQSKPKNTVVQNDDYREWERLPASSWQTNTYSLSMN